jgi:Fe-S-cluster containining protein
MNSVPCGDCSLCCSGEIKLMLPFDYYEKEGEVIPRFVSMPHTTPDRDGAFAVGMREGWCVYLKDGKCAIHNDKPKLCREFDCRNLAMLFPTTEQVSLFPGVNIEVWKRGKDLREEAA